MQKSPKTIHSFHSILFQEKALFLKCTSLSQEAAHTTRFLLTIESKSQKCPGAMLQRSEKLFLFETERELGSQCYPYLGYSSQTISHKKRYTLQEIAFCDQIKMKYLTTPLSCCRKWSLSHTPTHSYTLKPLTHLQSFPCCIVSCFWL